ncbi:MBL fold metallo-hydrolase [Paenirhodobacter populi]|uniref:MBL fold metallo-hydrolase n=1 Tax=Paenirhodobacter populi TaxID=2306993 RepID=A0A443JJK9_9RHOB|nr:MBL fold metallo-hydrolase [Sinirhodobacter populi]RWR09378.1 MBL fold metallo-hydrolase [Sinirhodobacter populi]RWR13013.1 MBL fold metallo-hydrolase [Sinirhodobacter populi]RWR20779.1 MBL fold metallo-hydrolase [Sinirhodobacter populi]RWR29758.1 MBL fold metallo-hydrolase [Sinirhodobacter populi]
MSRLRFTILGCGSSGGVPRIGNIWGECNPENPRNRRLRCSMLVERITREGITRVLIDTTPDLREQLLRAGVGELDAVVYTHPHADHVHGLDDLRQVAFLMERRLPVWADSDTQEALISRFAYAFVQPPDSNYHPICELRAIRGPFEITGAGGTIPFIPFRVEHGNIDALGFRIGGLAYLPDVSAIPEPAWEHLQGLDCWIVDALRRRPHPTHAHLARALEWVERAGAASAVLTNMHVDLDYDAVAAETPANVRPAYDGMVLEFAAP